jgi:hypothetical protein
LRVALAAPERRILVLIWAFVGHGGGDLDGEADAVVKGAAVAVGALVGVVGQKLVHQASVGVVDLHAVRARHEGGDDDGRPAGRRRACRGRACETSSRPRSG